MFRFSPILLVVCFYASPDLPGVYDLRMPTPGLTPELSLPELPSAPDPFLAALQQPSRKGARLQHESRLEIIRYVSGEFAHVVKPLPSAKKGFRIVVGKSLDEKALNQELTNHGVAASPGDTVQITRLEFGDKDIVVEINGGARGHFHLRQHLQIGIGGAPTPTVTSTSSTPGAPEQRGSTLILDYGRPLPDMSPDDVKQALSGFLDFSKERSAALNWVDTLPPEYRQAIQNRQAVVGMDHEMVLAALGRPDHKVRERDPNGEETEDWIYGTPPAKTVFVTFSGDKVIRVREFR